MIKNRPNIDPPVDKKWTAEEAIEANEKWAAANQDVSSGDPRMPLFRWEALHHLDELERQFNEGDRFALMSAIRRCASHDLVMPNWVVRAYIRGFDAVLNCRAGSWDDAFGRPYPKGAHLGTMRRNRELRVRIWLRVKEIRATEKHTPIDDGLFERVGKEFGLSRSLANDLYYQAMRMMPRLPEKS